MPASLGQILLVGVPGYELDPETARIFRKVQPGGFILFGVDLKNQPITAISLCIWVIDKNLPNGLV